MCERSGEREKSAVDLQRPDGVCGQTAGAGGGRKLATCGKGLSLTVSTIGIWHPAGAAFEIGCGLRV
jgi:hypothetical protein